MIGTKTQDQLKFIFFSSVQYILIYSTVQIKKTLLFYVIYNLIYTIPFKINSYTFCVK